MNEDRKKFIEACQGYNANFLKDRKYILKYARDRKNRPVGVVMAFKNLNNDAVLIGYSKCKTKAKGKPLDQFSKPIGIHKAIEDASPLNAVNTEVPNSLRSLVSEMRERAKKYFKVS